MGFCIYRVLWCPLQQAMWVFVIAAAAQSAANLFPQGCPNFESFWISVSDEIGTYKVQQGLNTPESAFDVPTAAGNLISHLAAKLHGGSIAYPYNFGLDERKEANPSISKPFPYYDMLVNNLDERDQTPEEYYLGGQFFIAKYNLSAPDAAAQQAEREEKLNKYSLQRLLKTDATIGTQLEDARTGLQQYLDNTNRLGSAQVVGINRSSTQNDYTFLKDFDFPYMLHINQSCLTSTAYDYPANQADIRTQTPPLPRFHGSTLGHTIVVYNAETQNAAFSSLKILKLSGASGLGMSRATIGNPPQINNLRGCDVTETFVHETQKCIDGITYIQLPPTPSPTLSPTPSPTPFPTPSPSTPSPPSPSPPSPSPPTSPTPSPPTPSPPKSNDSSNKPGLFYVPVIAIAVVVFGGVFFIPTISSFILAPVHNLFA